MNRSFQYPVLGSFRLSKVPRPWKGWRSVWNRIFSLISGWLLVCTADLSAEFLVLTRTTTTGGVPANEIQGWPSAAAFLAGGPPVNRYGVRPGSTEIEMRFATTDPGGELLTLQAATGTDGTYDVYRWRDPYRFAANEGVFVITRYNVGKLVAVTGDGAGRIYAVEEIGGTAGAYRVKFWSSIDAFSTYQQPTVLGECANVPDLTGIEFIDGQLYGISPATVGGAPGYQVRRWADFSGFLAGPGTLLGACAFDGQIVELLSPRTDRHRPSRARRAVRCGPGWATKCPPPPLARRAGSAWWTSSRT